MMDPNGAQTVSSKIACIYLLLSCVNYTVPAGFLSNMQSRHGPLDMTFLENSFDQCGRKAIICSLNVTFMGRTIVRVINESMHIEELFVSYTH